MKSYFKKILSLLLLVFISLSLTACDGFFVIGGNDTSDTDNEKTNTTILVSDESPYTEAVSKGYQGSYTEWLVEVFETEEYKSIWEDLKNDDDFNLTLSEFIASLKGEKGSNNIQDAATEGLLSAVTISCYASETVTVNSTDFFGRSKGSYQVEVSGGCSGSGVIFKDERDQNTNEKTGVAYIITNYHVCFVEMNSSSTSQISASKSKIADEIYVFLYGMDLASQKIEATFIGGSADYDIAVIKIESDLYKNNIHKPCAIGNSDKINTGESVIAIGNSNGEGTSVTSGIVSVPNDIIEMDSVDNQPNESYTNTFKEIRIDASVNPGNSGGGLYNQDGELIGIVNAKEVDEDTEGMGYALPINISMAVANKILNNTTGDATQKFSKCLLGITIERTNSHPVYNSTTNTLSIVSNISVNEVGSTSVCLNKLQAGDILEYVVYNGNEYYVSNLNSLEPVLISANKNDQLEIHFKRIVNETLTEMSVTVTLSNTTEI